MIQHLKLNLWRKGYGCSYCEERMLFTSKKVKRPVPQSAKDLNIYEEVECWECINCKQTSTDFITDCNSCGQKVLNFEEDGDERTHRDLSSTLYASRYPQGASGIYGYLRDVGFFRDPKYPAQCMNCVTCNECNQKILDNSAQSQIFDRFVVIDDDNDHYRFFFLHENCVEQSPLNKNYQNQFQQNRNKGAGCANSLLAVIGLLAITLTFLVVGVLAVFLPV